MWVNINSRLVVHKAPLNIAFCSLRGCHDGLTTHSALNTETEWVHYAASRLPSLNDTIHYETYIKFQIDCRRMALFSPFRGLALYLTPGPMKYSKETYPWSLKPNLPSPICYYMTAEGILHAHIASHQVSLRLDETDYMAMTTWPELCSTNPVDLNHQQQSSPSSFSSSPSAAAFSFVSYQKSTDGLTLSQSLPRVLTR